MKAERSWWVILAALGLAAAPLLGCAGKATQQKEEESQKQESEEQQEEKGETAKEKAREAGQDVKAAAEKAGEKASEVAEKAGQKASEAAGKLGEKVEAAKQTLDVKAALMAEKGLDASHIDVDTNEKTKTVTLNGTVPTKEEKRTAGRIAREKAEGYTVENKLTVAAHTSSK